MPTLPTTVRPGHPRTTPRRRSIVATAAACLASLLIVAPVRAQSTSTTLPILVADFNHDGIPDVLAISATTPTATIVFGSVPYGTFAGTRALTFPSQCNRFYTGVGGSFPLTVGDFDNDGFPDIVFRCRSSQTQGFDDIVGLMRGLGDGTFATPVMLPVSFATESVVGDFNRDGKLDLVLIAQPSSGSYGISFYSGNGDGTFAPPVNSPFGTSSTFNPRFVIESAAAADVNGDGFLDLVTESIVTPTDDPTGAPRTLSVFGNNQAGAFGIVAQNATTPNTTVVLGTYPAVNAFTVLPANVFSTGKQDFIIPDIGTNPGILAIRNTSTATSYSLATPTRTPYPALQDARPGSFTGTAFSDLAIANGTTIAILANDGTGNFTASYASLTATSATSGIGSFSAADANGDGYADIYSAASNGSGVSVTVNLVSGTATATSQPITLPIGTTELSASWPGNLNYNGSSATGSQTVTLTPTTVSLSGTPNPAISGTPVTFTAVVASVATTTQVPTGIVTFLDGATTLGTGTLDNTGTATFTTSALSATTHSIQATYPGDTFFATSASSFISENVTAPGQLTANLLLNPGAELGTLQYWTITGPGTPTVDTGSFDGGINPHTGAYDFLGHDSASDSLSQTVAIVTQGVTSAMIDTGTLRAGLSFWEQGLNQGTPSDDASVTLTFLDGSGATLSSVNSGEIDSHLNVWQNFSNSYPIPAGTRSITYTMNFVRHAGSDLDGFVDDNSLTILAATAPAAAPTITWTPPSPIPYGTPLSATQLDAAATNANGVAIPGTYTYTPAAGTVLPIGVQNLSVLFTPTDLNAYTTATATVPITVTSATPTTTLTIVSGTSPVTTVAQGTVVTLIATVRSGTTPITPGQVVFCDASATTCTDIHLLGTAQLTASGTAILKFIPAIGSHTYKALFLGTTNYASAASTVTPLAVTGRYTTTTTLTQGGGPGNYTLTATTTGLASPSASPTGTVSFRDTTNANAVLGTAQVGTSVSALALATSTTPATGSGASTVFSGDFNNDGKPDLAVLNQVGSTITILLGNGDGTFTVSANVPSPFGAYFITAGDFNQDGKLDLALALFNDVSGVGPTGSVTIIPGNGDGTFAASLRPISLPGPVALATGDFNADGIPDLAVVLTDLQNGTAANSSVTILLGNGDGTFATNPSIPTGAGPDSIAIGDFNGDGRPDIATANSVDNTVTILLGNGDGTFTNAASPGTGQFPRSVRTADFNADGKLDLVVANAAGTTLTVLLGNGDGTFTPATASPVTGTTPNSIAIGDFNADGKPDLALTNYGDSTASIFLGNGDGTFAARINSAVGASPLSLAAADFNGDGETDIAASSSSLGNATILLTQLTETATATATNISPIGVGTHQVIATYPGDTSFAPSASTPVALTAQQLTPTLTWTPAVPTIPYGTPLSLTQQLNAVVTTPTGVALPGTNTYTPAAGTVLSVGAQTIRLLFTPTDSNYTSIAATRVITVTQATPTLTWPIPAAIPYGSALTTTQLNASASVPGTIVYTPALGTLLSAGTQTLSATFTPSDTLDYAAVTITRALTVTQSTPAIAWATPAPIPQGTALSATQLNATATGVTGAALPGTFVYNPASGTVPAAGTQTLSVTFTPTDAVDYTTVTRTVQLQVIGLTLTSFTPNAGRLGDADKTITLTGSGFTTATVAQANTTRLATTFVNATTLTAIVPAANFTTVGTIAITVANAAPPTVSASLPLVVTAPTPSITVTAPSTTAPGSQPSLALTVANPYPVPLTASFTLNFASSVTPIVDDPSIQFATGGRTFTFTLPANSTTVPAIQLQAGTVAGTITIPVTLTAAGVNVTPTTVQPVVITVPAAVPNVTAATITRGTNTFTVTIHGFSNTREVATAAFHFMPATGAVIDTPDVTVPVTSIFSGWFTSTPSVQYGSTFTYTQVFNVSDTAANIGSIQVTLTNSAGQSTVYTAQ